MATSQVQQPEAMVTKSDLARHFAVSTRTIERWMAEGCPHERLWHGEGPPRFYISAVKRWHGMGQEGLCQAGGKP
jgi:phage terminase Nu1 subunit (DNA packaging protein)